jgi:hypothetical protein
MTARLKPRARVVNCRTPAEAESHSCCGHCGSGRYSVLARAGSGYAYVMCCQCFWKGWIDERGDPWTRV